MIQSPKTGTNTIIAIIIIAVIIVSIYILSLKKAATPVLEAPVLPAVTEVVVPVDGVPATVTTVSPLVAPE
jgi:LPXTG-motif cell wall-anchored protein